MSISTRNMEKIWHAEIFFFFLCVLRQENIVCLVEDIDFHVMIGGKHKWKNMSKGYWNNATTIIQSYHYNAIQYNMTFHIALCWLKQNINQSVISQITPHISP